jgi:hypothetical protein
MCAIISNAHISQFLLGVVIIASAEIFQVIAGNTMEQIWPVISAKNQVTLSMVRAIYAPQMKFAQWKIGDYMPVFVLCTIDNSW